MANLDLSKYGIQDVKEILHNPSYEVLTGCCERNDWYLYRTFS